MATISGLNHRVSSPNIGARAAPTFMIGSQEECVVKTYMCLVGRKKIDITYSNEKGLSAFVYTLDSQDNVISKSVGLPLTNTPKEIALWKDPTKLRRFFENTHLIPEKGIEGQYDRISVHISGKGGLKIKIPFQPGLALGSIVKGETLKSLEEYATQTSEIEAKQERLTALEQRIQILQAKITSREASLARGSERPAAPPATRAKVSENPPAAPPAQDLLIAPWTSEITQLNAQMNKLSEELVKPTLDKSPSPFQDFYQGAESPIDMSGSCIEIQPRGFDSQNYSSQYIDMSENLSEITSRIEQASTAYDASVGIGWGPFKAKVSRTSLEGTLDRLSQIKKEGKAQGVLMVNAMVTTRHVRCFREIRYDKIKLKAILNAMSVPAEHAQYGITTIANGVKVIYILTEVILGGSFTGLVTFLKQNSIERQAHLHAHEKDSSTKATLSGGYAKFSASGGLTYDDHKAGQSEKDLLRNLSNTQINIEILSQGVITTFTRSVIEHEIMNHLEHNPASFELSKKDEADAETIVKAEGQEREVALLKRRMKLDNTEATILNTYRGLTSEKRKQTLHTPDSLMAAYDSFSEQITTDSECGVPIGFNYQVLTESRIKDILSQQEDKK